MNLEEKYRSFQTWKLIEIIDTPEDYTSEAITKAQIELNRRKLNQKQLQSARQIRTEQKKDIENNKRKNENLVKKVIMVFKMGANLLIPFSYNKPSTNRQLNLIAIITGLSTIYIIYSQFNFLLFLFIEPNFKWDFYSIMLIGSILFMGSSTILFLFRKILGWIGVCIQFTILLLLEFVKLFNAFLYPSSKNINTENLIIQDYIPSKFGSNISYIETILMSIILLITLNYLLKPKIRKRFNLNIDQAILTIILTSISFFIFALYYLL